MGLAPTMAAATMKKFLFATQPSNDLGLLAQSIPIAKELRDRGHHALPEEVLPLPSNFRLTPFVPGLAMAERCDLVIHHGGYGSSQTGLYTGTPAVIIPTYSERESNARRIAASGAGEFVLPKTDASGKRKTIDTSELRTKIERVLLDQSYRQNAGRISEKLKKFSGASKAANLIETFCATP